MTAVALFTIEPGISLADEEIGVRIVDDYLATEEGLVELTAALPSEPEEVEAVMAGEFEPSGGPKPVGAAAQESVAAP